jgi:hypothetical protein
MPETPNPGPKPESATQLFVGVFVDTFQTVTKPCIITLYTLTPESETWKPEP